MARKRSFSYQDNDASVAETHAAGGGNYDNPVSGEFKAFRPVEGKSRIRILPKTWKDAEGPRHWAFPLWLHYSIGPDNAAYACPLKMSNGANPCPICEERARLSASGDETSAKELRPSLTQLAWVIDRNEEEVGPKVYRMPAQKIESALCAISRDEETGASLKIDHPDEGYDVTFLRKGTGRTSTDYTGLQVSRKTTPLSQDADEAGEWLDFIMDHPLNTVVQMYEYDYINRVFSGSVPQAQADDGDFEHDSVAYTRSDRKKSRASSVQEDEDSGDDGDVTEEFEDEQEDEQEEEAPAPRPAGGLRRRRTTGA